MTKHDGIRNEERGGEQVKARKWWPRYDDVMMTGCVTIGPKCRVHSEKVIGSRRVSRTIEFNSAPKCERTGTADLKKKKQKREEKTIYQILRLEILLSFSFSSLLCALIDDVSHQKRFGLCVYMFRLRIWEAKDNNEGKSYCCYRLLFFFPSFLSLPSRISK